MEDKLNINNINTLYDFAQKIYPICRSITGNGVRLTLKIIQEILPELKIHEVKTGTKCFDWEIPKEWNITNAYVKDPSGKKIIDFKENNLHIVGYSIPVNEKIPLSELQKYLHSLKEMPHAIPYLTSYYNQTWGFCLKHCERKKLLDGDYEVVIDSSLKDGSLTYGELIIPGKSQKEIFLSTYICHPSMGNNETSGPCVTTYLAKWLSSRDNYYTYRIIFVPETIGAVAYLSKNLKTMQKNTYAGFQITCVGDDNSYTLVTSRKANTVADKSAKHILDNYVDDYKLYDFSYRGSDERQYSCPRVDLPICSIMRTKYGDYKEYHTSLDDINFISANKRNKLKNVLKNIKSKGIKVEHDKFNVKQQIKKYVEMGGEIYACGTCMKSRDMESTNTCPISSMDDLYTIIKESDKVLTF